MKFDQEWVDRVKPCREGLAWLKAQDTDDAAEIVSRLVALKKWEWARWALRHSLSIKQLRQWAVFSAEQVLPIFESRYPEDKRPRQAIDAAVAVINNDTEENRRAAYTAYTAAAAAAYTAAYTAAAAAYTAAYTAAAADDAAAAADAAAARSEMWVRVLGYGVELLKGEG